MVKNCRKKNSGRPQLADKTIKPLSASILQGNKCFFKCTRVLFHSHRDLFSSGASKNDFKKWPGLNIPLKRFLFFSALTLACLSFIGLVCLTVKHRAWEANVFSFRVLLHLRIEKKLKSAKNFADLLGTPLFHSA